MNLPNLARLGRLMAGAALIAPLALSSTPASAGPDLPIASCDDLPNWRMVRNALSDVVEAGGNGGLANDMWVTMVDRDGIVCVVAFSGDDRDDQWPGSRVISAQKANTANAFSLGVDSVGFKAPLSTANLYSAVQPGGSLYGLQHSNPVDTDVAYRGNARRFGQRNDPMRGWRVGGVNVFGGGTALYGPAGEPIGAIGVSGDTSCTDHIVAWKVRDALGLDFVPGGVADGTDNMIYLEDGEAPNGFKHADCGFGERAISDDLPMTNPVSPLD